MRNTSLKAGTLRTALLGAAGGLAFAAGAQAQEYAQLDLSRLSLEELANVEITSVSRRPEAVSHAAASVYVISNDDIRRSDALTLPEALRLAPNLDVRRIDAASYAISARGFNGFQSANKLLVLIDGRSVYTPLFSGVLWETQNVMLEDVDRIEVISGPGGALWGANAVNGVINVITRDSRETQGALAHATAGETERQASVRYGGPIGGVGAWRAYATAFERDESLTLAGEGAGDEWRGGQVGFRTDFTAGVDTFTLQGDAYRSETTALMYLLNPEGELTGHNVTARWQRALSEGGAITVMAYYDRAKRWSEGLSDTIETQNIEGQYAFSLGDIHRMVVGAGYRATQDEFVEEAFFYDIIPPTEDVTLASAFVQDQIALRPDLTLTLGLKFEDSSFSGQEYMPSARIAWQMRDHGLLWGSVSRATRSPSRIERNFVIPGVELQPVLGVLVTPDTFESESVIAYEAGYRGQPTARLSLSATAFFNQYDDLRTNERINATQTAVLNGIEGETWGLEAWGAFDVNDWWRLSAGVSTLQKDFEVKDGRTDAAGLLSTGNDPEYLAQLRSQMTLPGDIEVDVALHSSDALEDPKAPAYVDADARIAWHLNESVEFSLAGFNLLDEARPEGLEPTIRRQVRRNVRAGLRWSF